MSNVFGLDIGTRNVVGTVGYKTQDDEFIVIAQHIRQHETRSMIDGQIHDIGRVARTIGVVKAELEKQIKTPLSEVCIAAAGRVLKTVTTHVEYNYPEESIVTDEDLHTLNLLGVEKAQDILKEKNNTRYKFYCVGYSIVKYYLNEEVFISLEGHKANKIGEDIIVTFLPEDVVDGLYSAVGLAGLTVANMTLEPIAAIDVAIPENYRMLNIALVDVGAGTSDISLTRDGSIIAYGMIPFAGDEVTELIVQHYLVDFKTAEKIKLASSVEEEITYEDIMNISHTIPAEEVWELVQPVVEKITSEVANKIKELNGDKTVSACFVVGGGGKIHGFTEKLAEYLELPEERVALRGEEVLGEVVFNQPDIKKDPLLVTPIGICLNYYEQKNNFIMVRFNGERLKLYDNNRLTIVDAALQAGFPNDQLFPKRGMPINFTVNGTSRIVRGEAGEPAIVTMNGEPAHINTPLEPNCEITIEPSTAGEAAVYLVSQLEEYKSSTVSFMVNGKKIICPKFVEVNGVLEPGTYEIKEGDVIETRSFYTVSQVAEFMDVEVNPDCQILVNNRPADFGSLVYENFSIDWTVVDFPRAAEVDSEELIAEVGDEAEIVANKPEPETMETESAEETEESEAEPEEGTETAESEEGTEAGEETAESEEAVEDGKELAEEPAKVEEAEEPAEPVEEVAPAEDAISDIDISTGVVTDASMGMVENNAIVDDAPVQGRKESEGATVTIVFENQEEEAAGVVEPVNAAEPEETAEPETAEGQPAEPQAEKAEQAAEPIAEPQPEEAEQTAEPQPEEAEQTAEPQAEEAEQETEPIAEPQPEKAEQAAEPQAEEAEQETEPIAEPQPEEAAEPQAEEAEPEAEPTAEPQPEETEQAAEPQTEEAEPKAEPIAEPQPEETEQAAEPQAEEAEQPAAEPKKPESTQTVEFKKEEPSETEAAESVQEPDAECCVITVNGERVVMRGRKSYIFVDLFNFYKFDLSASAGRGIITLLNGRDAIFTEELHEGDNIEIYWKEK